MNADGGKVDSKASMKVYASLDGFHQLRNIGMARVEAGVCVDDTNNWP